jgi:hypothetical protein
MEEGCSKTQVFLYQTTRRDNRENYRFQLTYCPLYYAYFYSIRLSSPRVFWLIARVFWLIDDRK